MAEGARVLGRRKTLTQARVWDLAAAYFLLSGYRLDEITKLSGRSPSALAELLAELREVGVPPDGSPGGTRGAALNEIAEAMAPYLLEQYPPNLDHWRGAGKIRSVEAPWAHDDVDHGEEEESVEGDEEGGIRDVGIGDVP
jgi:hypothetical protein